MFTKIGWLMRGVVVYILYWTFGFVVVGIIFSPRPAPLSIVLLVTVGAVPLTIVAVRKEYRMDELARYREWEQQGERWKEIRRRHNEEWERSILNPVNAFGYWRREER